MKNSNYLMDRILDHFEYILNNYGQKTVNPSIRIYINKIEKRMRLKIKTGYYLKLLTPEKMKLLGSTNSKISKNKNCENAPNLEANEVVLVNFNTFNNHYQRNSRV